MNFGLDARFVQPLERQLDGLCEPRDGFGGQVKRVRQAQHGLLHLPHGGVKASVELGVQLTANGLVTAEKPALVEAVGVPLKPCLAAKRALDASIFELAAKQWLPERGSGSNRPAPAGDGLEGLHASSHTTGSGMARSGQRCGHLGDGAAHAHQRLDAGCGCCGKAAHCATNGAQAAQRRARIEDAGARADGGQRGLACIGCARQSHCARDHARNRLNNSFNHSHQRFADKFCL